MLSHLLLALAVHGAYMHIEERDEDDRHERRLKLNIIVLTVTVLVAISLTFETLKERLLEHTSDNMLPIISSLFGELTLLGITTVPLYLHASRDFLRIKSRCPFS